jgi:tetratricopeptide (TPR) repeat protein
MSIPPSHASDQQSPDAASRHGDLIALFGQARALAVESRAEFISDLRGRTPELADELESLLAADSHRGLLDASIAGVASRIGIAHTTSPERLDLLLPQRVGRYTLSALLGRGGHGAVYRATQDQPRREVAIKLILPRATQSPRQPDALAARFSYEADVLGMLTHPGIARIFDAGMAPATLLDSSHTQITADVGYLAMEYVEGQRIDEAIRSADIHTTLRCLIELCDAVAHAHQRGVIHRDLKPSNVLSTTDGGVKVLDFGVARLISTEIDPNDSARIIGTLGYMSPEQAAGQQRVDARSDIYAIGAIACELLTARPFRRFDGLSITEALHAAAAAETPRTLTLRHTGPIAREMHDVLLKALARDPDARYQHIGELADDLRAALRGDAVSARTQARPERVRRWLAAHKGLVAATSAVMLTLAAGLATTTWQARRADAQRQAAAQEAASARAATRLLRRVLTSASPTEALGRDVTVRELLTTAESELTASDTPSGGLRDDYARATVLSTLGETRLELGDYQLALQHAQRAIALLDDVAADRNRPDSDDDDGQLASTMIEARSLLTQAALKLDTPDLARPHLQRARQIHAAMPTGTPAQREAAAESGYTLEAMAIWLGTGQHAPHSAEARTEAVAGFQKLLATMQQTLPPDDLRLDRIRNDLAVDLEELGQREAALKIATDLHASRVARLGPDHPETLVSRHNMATYLGELGNTAEAIILLHDVIRTRQRVIGPNHPSTAFSHATRAKFLAREGKFADALQDAQLALIARTERLGPAHRDTLETMGLHATLLVQLGRLDEAAPQIDLLVSRSREAFGERDVNAIMAITLAWDLAEARKDREGMIRHARALIGTPYEAPVREQMKAKGISMD